MRPALPLLLLGAVAATAFGAAPPPGPNDAATRTPIRHLVIVVGENVSFDALFATYQPPAGQTVRNLLAAGIVRTDGTPGPHYARAVQHQHSNPGGHYTLDPVEGAPYARLPQPSLTGVYDMQTGQPYGSVPDPRFAGLAVNGPFQISRFAAYGAQDGHETGDPVHRFFQMWQQTGGSNANLHRYAWVATTTGRGGDSEGVTPEHVDQGAELMGFFNMAAGDAPYFRGLADRYALSDNYHQSLMGGTTANFLAIATGDAAIYEHGGHAATPPARQIDDPNPAPGTANFYVHDGFGGGSYVRCDEASQPGVAPILQALAKLHRAPHCEPGTYYLVNNYDPPFLADGTPVPLGPERSVYPPQSKPDIGSALGKGGVSWAWYTGGRDREDIVDDPLYALAAKLATAAAPTASAEARAAATLAEAQGLIYNNSGDPLTAFPAVIQGPGRDHLQNLKAVQAAIAAGDLPAVSFVVPKNIDSGPPGYSASARYELFVRDLLARFEANPALYASTAIVITTDEGGGYFDSGWIQTLDFFGDGPRIPMLVVSPYARRGHVDHVYQDHASLLKFIEYNWSLPPLSARSRDRLPNPRPGRDPYRPANQPAIGDLTSMFDFGGARPKR